MQQQMSRVVLGGQSEEKLFHRMQDYKQMQSQDIARWLWLACIAIADNIPGQTTAIINPWWQKPWNKDDWSQRKKELGNLMTFLNSGASPGRFTSVLLLNEIYQLSSVVPTRVEFSVIVNPNLTDDAGKLICVSTYYVLVWLQALYILTSKILTVTL